MPCIKFCDFSHLSLNRKNNNFSALPYFLATARHKISLPFRPSKSTYKFAVMCILNLANRNIANSKVSLVCCLPSYGQPIVSLKTGCQPQVSLSSLFYCFLECIKDTHRITSFTQVRVLWLGDQARSILLEFSSHLEWRYIVLCFLPAVLFGY